MVKGSSDVEKILKTEFRFRLQNIYEPVQEELSLVESSLRGEVGLITKGNSPVEEILSHFFRVPGKRLRPALVLLSVNSVDSKSAVSDGLVKLCSAVELIHSASLIHDDIIDASEIRRNQQSLDEKYGSKVAVLAGDILYARAFGLLTTLPGLGCDERAEVLKIFCDTTQRMCNGEILEQQVLDSGRSLTDEDYLCVIRDKTACFMSACCQCGALLAGADKKLTASLAHYGLNFGMAYQIVDDEVDGEVFAKQESRLGKAREFASKARDSIKILNDSVYKEKLVQLLDYILVS